jgi:hypothetical protein
VLFLCFTPLTFAAALFEAAECPLVQIAGVRARPNDAYLVAIRLHGCAYEKPIAYTTRHRFANTITLLASFTNWKISSAYR